ncbi:MAG TPA: serine/threonine-protein kinase, partial [Kofleriaceae bacterium]|nr:serine/threonine-protein kinase [Kofleriaceae bacterium]
MPRALGRYELVRAIGRGGMAEVFLARRRGAAGIAKRLVVKRMRQDLTSDPRFAELFLREARVATQLSHKNIVTVFDVGRDDEGLFLAMDYVEGPDLAAAIERARERDLRFDPLLAAHIASEVAAGLEYAHRVRDEQGAPLGLVHRDVTPRNILLSLDGEVKVTDFGVAVLHGDSTEERRGTVPYMSPEQARGESVDPRADLFSLGLVLYELLAGRRAHEGGDRDTVLALARAGEVPPLEADVPPELARVVTRATAVARDDRYASAREMQRELAGWAVGERGRRGQTDPLEHALASFLARVAPDWAEQTTHADGRTAGEAGTATLRSVAETVGESRSRPPRVESTEPTRRSRRPAALLAAAVAVVGAAALFAVLRSDETDPQASGLRPRASSDLRPPSGLRPQAS